MMELNNKAIRFLARMGSRGAFGQAIYDLAKDGVNFYTASADLAHASGFDRIITNFPERMVDVGIAEQNLVSVAAGLAKDGTPVFATSWAMFASVRCTDQVRNFMGYMQNNVKLIGMDSGFEQARFGYSHMNPPDIAVMRTIPNIVILSPCDGLEIYKAVYAVANYKGPIYMRITGGAMVQPIHKDPDFKFEIGKAIVLREGEGIAFVACGSVLKRVLGAADILKEAGISSTVIDMHTICPLDTECLDHIKKYKLVVTVEEHTMYGGLGSAVAEYYAGSNERPVQLILGTDDHIPKAGTRDYIAGEYGLLSEQIAQSIIEKLREM